LRERSCALALGLSLPALVTAAVKLPAGTVVDLELQQTITSGYTPVDRPVYFRVKDDVLAGGQVLIRRGTLVSGRMVHAQNQERMAQSGSFSYDVHFVPAVDGQNIRVIAGTTRAGRDRNGALATEVILWGVFGLLTHGANAWIERGSILEAQVLTDKQIDVEHALDAAAVPLPAAYHGVSSGHRFGFTSAKAVELNLEKSRTLGTVRFDLQPDRSVAVGDHAPWQLTSVDGAPLPEPVGATHVDGKGAEFDAWSVLQYLRDGDNTLGFVAKLPDGALMDATDMVTFHLRRGK
jgi:hypothetical protein